MFRRRTATTTLGPTVRRGRAAAAVDAQHYDYLCSPIMQHYNTPHYIYLSLHNYCDIFKELNMTIY